LVNERLRGGDQGVEKDRGSEGGRARERGGVRRAKERMTLSSDHRVPSIAVPEIQQTDISLHQAAAIFGGCFVVGASMELFMIKTGFYGKSSTLKT
jgi:hypothetical protein